jgi:hypothetical protein
MKKFDGVKENKGAKKRGDFGGKGSGGQGGHVDKKVKSDNYSDLASERGHVQFDAFEPGEQSISLASLGLMKQFWGSVKIENDVHNLDRRVLLDPGASMNAINVSVLSELSGVIDRRKVSATITNLGNPAAVVSEAVLIKFELKAADGGSLPWGGRGARRAPRHKGRRGGPGAPLFRGHARRHWPAQGPHQGRQGAQAARVHHAHQSSECFIVAEAV